MKLYFMAAVIFVAAPAFAQADELSCISTTFNLLSPNDKVCVADFDDPKVPGRDLPHLAGPERRLGPAIWSQ